MFDFLTRLVTATYEPAASVRPRPVAHYEPLGAALPVRPVGEHATAATVLAEPGAPPAHQAQSPPDRTASRRTAAGTQDSRAMPPLSVAARTPTTKFIASQVQAVHQNAAPPINPPATAPLPPHRTRRDAESPVPASTATPAGQSRQASAAAAPHAAGETPRQPAQGVAAPLRAAVTLPPQRSAPLRGMDAAPGDPASQVVALAVRREVEQPVAAPAPSAPRTGDETHSAQEAARRVTLRSEQVANSPRVTLSAPPATDAPPAPVIRVSIGRIIVKAERPAAPASPAPRPAPAPSPSLSLEGYLKTRNGGDT